MTKPIEDLREELDRVREARVKVNAAFYKHPDCRELADACIAAHNRFHDLRDEIKSHPDYRIEGL